MNVPSRFLSVGCIFHYFYFIFTIWLEVVEVAEVVEVKGKMDPSCFVQMTAEIIKKKKEIG